MYEVFWIFIYILFCLHFRHSKVLELRMCRIFLIMNEKCIVFCLKQWYTKSSVCYATVYINISHGRGLIRGLLLFTPAIWCNVYTSYLFLKNQLNKGKNRKLKSKLNKSRNCYLIIHLKKKETKNSCDHVPVALLINIMQGIIYLNEYHNCGSRWLKIQFFTWRIFS